MALRTGNFGIVRRFKFVHINQFTPFLFPIVVTRTSKFGPSKFERS